MHTYLQTDYLADRVLTASSLELIRMLYEAALSSVELARELLATRDVRGRGQAITKAINILYELRASLRDEAGPELAANLSRLYEYMQKRLFDAHARKSEEALLEVAGLLKDMHETWLGVMRQVAESPAEKEREAPERVAERITIPLNPYAMAFASPAAGRSWNL